jgi:hypothetical protein
MAAVLRDHIKRALDSSEEVKSFDAASAKLRRRCARSWNPNSDSDQGGCVAWLNTVRVNPCLLPKGFSANSKFPPSGSTTSEPELSGGQAAIE